MEKHRQELIQQKRFWGDSTPGDGAKSGKLINGLVDHCLATYNAAGAQLNVPTLNPSPLISAKPNSISALGWSINKLVASYPNFKPARRISVFSKAALNPTELEKYDKEGIPVIIENFHKNSRWPDEFNLQWFQTNGPPKVSVRNVIDGSDKQIPTSDFIEKCRTASSFVTEQEQERLYGKDVECPQKWREALSQFGIPKCLLPGTMHDLLANQPSKGRVETLMCYLGIGDTFTPFHKDLCASSGQNLMCYTENNGSSLWFMTATKDVFKATAYFHSINNEVDHENRFIGLDQLSKAPFTVYVAEQKLGDLVLVPSRSCHQVINRGGITVKTSWSRMSLDGLIAAYYHELPIYQRVCRPETYRIKHTIYHTLLNNIEKLKHGGQSEQRLRATSTRSANAPGESLSLSRKRPLLSLQLLLGAYDDILSDEAYNTKDANKTPIVLHTPTQPSSTSEDTDDRITCDFCSADIFQSFLECRVCVKKPGEVTPGYGCVVCPRCYVDGRTCRCGTMNPAQCRPFDDLLKVRDEAIEVLKRYNVKLPIKPLAKEDLSAGVFAAACIKNHTKDPNVITTCDSQADTHEIRTYDSLYCASCRKTCCFWHILNECDTHAVDALIRFEADQQLYHKTYHDGDRPRISKQDISKFAESVKRGYRPDLEFQRYHLTAFHRKSLPASQYVRPGYYDEGWYSTDQIPSPEKPASEPIPPSSSDSERQANPDPLLTGQEVSVEKPAQESRKRKRWVLDYIEIPLPPTRKNKRGSKVNSQARPVVDKRASPPAPEGNDNALKLRDSDDAAMGQPADTISPVEQQDNLSAQASFDMEVDECGDDRQSRGQDDDSLSEVRANESGAGERSEGSRAPEGWSERVGTRKPGPRTRTAKESPRKQTPTRTRKLVSRKEPRIPSRTGNVTDQPNSEHMLEEELSDPPTESPVMTSGPCGASVEPQSTDDSDTAVAESDGHLRIATTSAVKLPGTSSGIPRRALSEESPSSPSSSSLTRRKESSRDVAGGKKKLATASGMRRTVSSSTTGSADEEPVTPRTKRTKIGKSPSATKSQRRARVEPREDSQEPNCAPSVAEALNTAWTANNNTSPISKTRRNSHTQVARDINAPVQVHGSTSHQEERRQPSLNSQEKEEYEKRIHDLESRLAAVEARDPKPMDQMFDVFVRRMKEAIPPPMSPQVYVTPIAVGSDCNAPFFVPTEPYGYRGNHVGASNFRSREPPRFPSHQANTYWQFSHHNNTRTGYGNRTQNVHHPNTGHYNRGQGFRGGGFQRGRRPGYGDYHNRERNNVALELSQRRYPSHWPTGPSDVYRHSGDTPSEVGSNDQHQHGGDTMNEPDEAHQEHTRESSPYEPVAETPASPENLNAGSDYGEGSRGASRSMNPLRPESDEHHWEDTYDQDNRVGDVNNKGDDQTRSGAVLNQIDVVNPWT